MLFSKTTFCVAPECVQQCFECDFLKTKALHCKEIGNPKNFEKFHTSSRPKEFEIKSFFTYKGLRFGLHLLTHLFKKSYMPTEQCSAGT